jgi:hypothetical protein
VPFGELSLYVFPGRWSEARICDFLAANEAGMRGGAVGFVLGGDMHGRGEMGKNGFGDRLI